MKARVEPKTRGRRLSAIDLWEISLVTFPLLNGACLHTVKGRRHDPDERLWRRHPRLSFAKPGV